MKLKVKISPNQFGELVGVIECLPYARIAITNLELINLKYFYFDGRQKMQQYQFKSVQMNKPRVFTIDVNHYEAIKSVLNECGNSVSAYTKTIFESMKRDAEPQILRAVSGYKLLG